MIIPRNQTLLPFQIEAVNKMLAFLDQGKGCYNACEMGLGKSIQTIVTLNTLACNKVLIICPAVMRPTWGRETRKWSTLQPRSLIVESAEDVKGIYHADYVIISYDLATRYSDVLSEFVWDALVVDEAHSLKNYKAKRTKEILTKIWDRAKVRIALSGTPFTQSVVDGYTLFNALAPDLFPDWWSFVSRFSFSKATPWGTQYYGVKSPELLSDLIRNRFYIRYKKADVLKDLPPKIFTPIYLPETYTLKLNKEEQKEFETFKKEFRQAMAMGANRVPPAPKALGTKRREQGEKKVPAVADFVGEMLEQEIPVVLFAYHRSVITGLMEALKKHNPVLIWGDTSPQDRVRAVDDFQEGRTNLFIGQMVAAGVGITLTRSSNVVMAELDWSPATVSQATDRCHRIGQKDSVTVHYFIVENSIDEDIIETVVNKAKTFSQVLDEKAIA